MPTTNRGFFEIGIFQPKTTENVGTLWRTAYQLGASGIFTIGSRCREQTSDTYKSWRHIPLRNFESFKDFQASIPYSCPLIGIEQGGTMLTEYNHPQRAIYILGSEDSGLPPNILQACAGIISLPSIEANSYNVAVAGALVMFDRQFSNR